LLYPHWWLSPPLLPLFPAILTVSKNITKPVKDQSTAPPVKTAANAAIAQKEVVPAVFAGN
jgi:hypothetical protein